MYSDLSFSPVVTDETFPLSQYTTPYSLNGLTRLLLLACPTALPIFISQYFSMAFISLLVKMKKGSP